MITSNPRNGYSSQDGWNLSLPKGWRVLPKVPIEISQGLDNIEVFAHPNDPSLSITWMRSANEIGLRGWQNYSALSRTIGAISASDAKEAVQEIFPLMGTAVTAFVVALSDGQKAIELTEEITPVGGGTESMRGYHLVLPVRSSRPLSPFMQQLAFYARTSKFAQEIVEVIRSARSFGYF